MADSNHVYVLVRATYASCMCLVIGYWMLDKSEAVPRRCDD